MNYFSGLVNICYSSTLHMYIFYQLIIFFDEIQLVIVQGDAKYSIRSHLVYLISLCFICRMKAVCFIGKCSY